MIKDVTRTPDGKIRSALRKMWLRSRERAFILKQKKYCCEECGIKQSKAKGREVKVEVHHKDGVSNWYEIIKVIREKLLVSPDKLQVLCVNCHAKKTYGSDMRFK